MIPESLSNEQKVSDLKLRERLELIRELHVGADQYEAVFRDKKTGEHYLHHADRHLNVADGGAEEMYHAFLPLETDDVIGMLVGGMRFTYPEDWKSRYLRNGPDGYFVWFDPEMTQELDADAQFGRELLEKMKAFKAQGQFSSDDIASLFQDIDRLQRPRKDELE